MQQSLGSSVWIVLRAGEGKEEEEEEGSCAGWSFPAVELSSRGDCCKIRFILGFGPKWLEKGTVGISVFPAPRSPCQPFQEVFGVWIWGISSWILIELVAVLIPSGLCFTGQFLIKQLEFDWQGADKTTNNSIWEVSVSWRSRSDFVDFPDQCNSFRKLLETPVKT